MRRPGCGSPRRWPPVSLAVQMQGLMDPQHAITVLIVS